MAAAFCVCMSSLTCLCTSAKPIWRHDIVLLHIVQRNEWTLSPFTIKEPTVFVHSEENLHLYVAAPLNLFSLGGGARAEVLLKYRYHQLTILGLTLFRSQPSCRSIYFRYEDIMRARARAPVPRTIQIWPYNVGLTYVRRPTTYVQLQHKNQGCAPRIHRT